MQLHLYKILNIPETATKTEIKKAYRALAKKYHPDKGLKKNTTLFNEITQAYKILSDDTKRAYYDKTGDIDDKPKFSIYQQIAKEFQIIIDSSPDLAQINIIDTLKDKIEGRLKKAEEHLNDLEKLIVTREGLTKRIIRKDEIESNNVLLKVLEGNINKLKADIEQVKKDQETFKNMLEILAEYKDTNIIKEKKEGFTINFRDFTNPWGTTSSW